MANDVEDQSAENKLYLLFSSPCVPATNEFFRFKLYQVLIRPTVLDSHKKGSSSSFDSYQLE